MRPRVCSKTSAGREAYFQPNDPHPDPLPSDGRGNSQPRLSQLPKRLDRPTGGGRFSLSHPTQAAPEASPRRVGEGRAFAAPPPSRRSGRFGAPRRRKRLRPRRRGEGECASKSEDVFARILRRLLVPRHGHGRFFAMAVAAPVFRAVLEPVDETRELFDGFFVGSFALFAAGQFRVAQNAGLTVAAGPGNQRRRTGGKKV